DASVVPALAANLDGGTHINRVSARSGIANFKIGSTDRQNNKRAHNAGLNAKHFATRRTAFSARPMIPTCGCTARGSPLHQPEACRQAGRPAARTHAQTGPKTQGRSRQSRDSSEGTVCG